MCDALISPQAALASLFENNRGGFALQLQSKPSKKKPQQTETDKIQNPFNFFQILHSSVELSPQPAAEAVPLSSQGITVAAGTSLGAQGLELFINSDTAEETLKIEAWAERWSKLNTL